MLKNSDVQSHCAVERKDILLRVQVLYQWVWAASPVTGGCFAAGVASGAVEMSVTAYDPFQGQAAISRGLLHCGPGYRWGRVSHTSLQLSVTVESQLAAAYFTETAQVLLDVCKHPVIVSING